MRAIPIRRSCRFALLLAVGGLVAGSARGQDIVHLVANGMGVFTDTPAAELHVVDPSPGGNTMIVEGGVFVVKRTDGGPANIRFTNGTQAYLFANNAANNTFAVVDETAGQTPFSIFPSAGANLLRLRNGNVGVQEVNPTFPIHHGSGAHLTAAGVWTNASSRDLKTDFRSVEPQDVLAQVMELPVTSWRYNVEDETARHIGPVAEDFQQALGLGDGRHIGTVDADGVLLAAVQGLKQQLDGREAEIEALQTALEARDSRLGELEQLVEGLRRQVDSLAPANQP